MWSVNNFSGTLPAGFKLMEDVEKVYLFFGDELVADFPAISTNPEEIEKKAEERLTELLKSTPSLSKELGH